MANRRPSTASAVSSSSSSSSHAAARAYRPKAPWDTDSQTDRDREKLKELDRDSQWGRVDAPWTLRPSDVQADEQRRLQGLQNYKFESLFTPPEQTDEQRRHVEDYRLHGLTAPFLCGNNGLEGDKRTSKRMVSSSGGSGDNNNKQTTRSPWDYGSLPSEPVKKHMFERPKTVLWDVADSAAGDQNQGFATSGDPILDQLRLQLRQRGAGTMIGLSKKFRIMDDDGSGTLNYEEFRKGMKECGLGELTERSIKHLFLYFDRDDSGVVSYDEFLVGIRGILNERRKQMVAMAFRILDRDHSGLVDLQDVEGVYNTSMHPDVIAGKLTEKQALLQFLSSFENNSHAKSLTKGDGCITLEEFEEYYASLSACIDDDDYFELMIRNAWHISGGSNAMCTNTTNRRVLVTNQDGTQVVKEIENDIGISAKDTNAMFKKLQQQMPNSNIATLNLNGLEGMNNQVVNPYAKPPPNTDATSSRRSSHGSQNQHAGAGNIGQRSLQEINKPVPLSQLFANQASNSVNAATAMNSGRGRR